jgi:hypothetical protein
MDANMAAFVFMQEAEEVEADIIDDEVYNTQLSVALLIAGAQEAQTLRSERRNKTLANINESCINKGTITDRKYGTYYNGMLISDLQPIRVSR